MISKAKISVDGSPTQGNSIREPLFSRDFFIGFALCLIACALTLLGFWKIGHGLANMLVVTDYVTEIQDGESITLGYGGAKVGATSQTGQYQNPDLPFQSRSMSSFGFNISREAGGTYWAEGEEDRLLTDGKEIESHKRVQIFSGSRLKAIGRYGSASFTVHLDEQPSSVRLHLDSPIYLPLGSDATRVTFGLGSEIAGTPIDEVTVRAKLRENQAETFIVIKDESGEYHLKREADLSLSTPTRSEIFTGGPNHTAGQQTGDFSVGSGDSIRAGTVLVKFGNSSQWSMLSAEPSWAFGLKFPLIVFLFAVAFGIQGLGMYSTQVRMPSGPVIFGCVALFSAIGLTLAGRDFFLPPYDQGRFSEYLKWFFVSSVVLYLIRIPLVTFYRWRWAYSFPVFLLAYILVGRPFDGIFFIPFMEFAIAFFFGAVAVHWLMRWLREAFAFLVDSDWLRVLLFGVVLPIIAIISVTFVMGGKSALNLFGVRFHLPTALMLVFTFGTVIVIAAAERERAATWRMHRSIALAAILAAVGLYYLTSSFDHGGTILLGFGVIAAMWAASRRDRPWVFTCVLALFIIGALYFAVVMGHERIDIAWGGEEGAERYFDQAVNLRTARDLARSGGLFGLYDHLYIPSSVSMNIYNDLVTAYIAGFFGFAGLLLVAICYYLFYTRLVDGICGLKVSKNDKTEIPGDDLRSLPGEAWPDMPSPYTESAPKPSYESDPDVVRHILVASVLAVTSVFLFQVLWVFTATLWRRIPISGLDLQPISASVISIVGFMVILLGSVTFVHNALQYEETLRSNES